MDTLDQRIARDGPLPERDAVGWTIRLCKRLEQLHRLGVAHGSISVHLILTATPAYTSRGVLADVRRGATRPAYHSPQRLSGQGIDQADDTWACAVVLYQLLTGQVPFSGETKAEIYRRVRTQAPAPLAVFDVGDDALQAVLDQHLSASDGRGTTVSGLRAALEAWHPDAGIGSVGALEEDERTFQEQDDEEGIQTVMRDFTEVREQIKQIQRERAAAASAVAAAVPAPVATIRGSAPSRPSPSSPSGGALPIPRARASAPAKSVPPRARASAPAKSVPPPPRARASAPAKSVPPPTRARQTTAPLATSAAATEGEASVSAAEPPFQAPRDLPPLAFDIEDDDSEDDVATVMMDTAGSELSKAIEEALGRPAAGAPSPQPNATDVPPAQRAATTNMLELEALAAQQPDDSGTKRTIIVGVVMAVLVLVVIGWLLSSSGTL